MKKGIFLTFCILGVLLLQAQNVTFTVKGDSLGGKTVKMSYFDDRISLLEKEIGSKKLSDGETLAEFQASLSGVKEMVLKVNLREFHFLARPGTKYSFEVLPWQDTAYSFAFKEILPVKMSMEKYDVINNSVEDADTTLENFLESNYRMLSIKNKDTKLAFDSLQQYLADKYKADEYSSDYIRYEFAAVSYALGLDSKKAIRDSLFKKSPVLYDNIGYMDCFNTVFSRYFSQGYKFIKLSDIEKWLDNNDYAAFNDALGRDGVLENEIFRELVFLQGMKDAFLDGIFSRERILAMLNTFIGQTKFTQHKEIAANLTEYLRSKDFSGKKTKPLEFKDIDGNNVSITQYNDKPLLLCIVRLSDISSLKELETIHFYYDSIKNNCNVLVLCCDNTFESMYNFVKNSKSGSKYQFPFIHFDFNWDIQQEYKLHFFPAFLLIGTDGTVLQNPMPAPSSGVLKKFFDQKQ
ncbi:MAG: redoxin domain-containing protein [Bacteroidales bacterium]|nr:redoxin domain-containing protein [Bacteroidales bacterium]